MRSLHDFLILYHNASYLAIAVPAHDLAYTGSTQLACAVPIANLDVFTNQLLKTLFADQTKLFRMYHEIAWYDAS